MDAQFSEVGRLMVESVVKARYGWCCMMAVGVSRSYLSASAISAIHQLLIILINRHLTLLSPYMGILYI